MHEYGLCEGIVDAVRKRAAGRPVAWVRIRAGARQGVDSESMNQAFHHVRPAPRPPTPRSISLPYPWICGVGRVVPKHRRTTCWPCARGVEATM